MQKTISYEPYCVDGYLVVPQQEKKLTHVYNIVDGAPAVKAHVEICALPKHISLQKKFDRQVFDILNKSGLYGSKESIKNSFFTPFENGKLSDKFDSSVLLRLTTAHFVWYLMNAKKGEFYGMYFEDLSYDWPEYKVFQINNSRMLGGIKEFEKEIKDNAKWKKARIEFYNKHFAHIK